MEPDNGRRTTLKSGAKTRAICAPRPAELAVMRATFVAAIVSVVLVFLWRRCRMVKSQESQELQTFGNCLCYGNSSTPHRYLSSRGRSRHRKARDCSVARWMRLFDDLWTTPRRAFGIGMKFRMDSVLSSIGPSKPHTFFIPPPNHSDGC